MGNPMVEAQAKKSKQLSDWAALHVDRGARRPEELESYLKAVEGADIQGEVSRRRRARFFGQSNPGASSQMGRGNTFLGG